jgi:tRNA-Thr(GGU) m(6)t(6)A37 methyltransferase TsaA
MSKKNNFQLIPIGHISRGEDEFKLHLDETYRPALKQLDRFSHVQVLWWADKHDNKNSRTTMQCELPYAPGETAGVFACRSEYRPNPIAVTVCEIISIDEESGIVELTNIDAFDKTPLLDLKPYIPVVDRVQEVKTPDWYAEWPEWFPAEGIGIYE